MPEHQEREIADAGRLADLWLDPVTTLPAPAPGRDAWTRREWLQQTLASWKQLVDPVASRVTAAMGGAMQEGLLGEDMMEGLPPELSGLLAGLGPNPFAGVLDQVGGVVFGAQVGMALAALAQEVLSTSDIGIPLGRSALVPANIAAFAEGLEVPLDEVRLYLALREAAHQRLFDQVPWLKRAPLRRGRRLRPRHRGRPGRDRAGGHLLRRRQPHRDAGGARRRRRRAVRARVHRGPAGRPGPARAALSRWSRGGSTWSWTRPRRRRSRTPAAARDGTAEAGLRRPGGADLRDAGRSPAAAAPAARGGRALGRR